MNKKYCEECGKEIKEGRYIVRAESEAVIGQQRIMNFSDNMKDICLDCAGVDNCEHNTVAGFGKDNSRAVCPTEFTPKQIKDAMIKIATTSDTAVEPFVAFELLKEELGIE